MTELSSGDAAELAREAVERRRERAATAAAARAGVARADALAADAGVGGAVAAASGVRAAGHWGWRAALRFGLARRMYTPEYALLYARYLAVRLRHPHVELRGMVFLGPRVELRARRHHGRLVLGPWCWVGAGTALRAHEGNLRLGPKVVLGSDTTVNAYLDVEIGEGTLVADRVYVCDFDHAYGRVDVPIRKQGIVKTPVRVGEDVWIGEKASILRGSDVGAGSVIGSHTLVKGRIPPFSVVAGVPGRVIRSRLPAGMTAEEALALQRAGRAIPGDPVDR